MRRKQHRGHEFDPSQKLKHENQQLKREVKKLRKIIRQIEDAEETKKLVYLVELQRQEDKILHDSAKHDKLIELKEKWSCHKCDDGVMVLQIFKRLDGVFYYRRCKLCGNKTKMKKYKEDVTGVTQDQYEKMSKEQ